MTDIGILVPVFLGLVFGSFATALSFRLPRGISIVSVRRSQCPSCHANLRALDLVPLLSWVVLRGRCRHCHKSIGWRYPLIELATLGLCLAFYAVYGLQIGMLPLFALAPVLVSIFDIDFRHKIIPDSLNLALLVTGVVTLLLNALLAPQAVEFLMTSGGAAVAGALLYGFGAWILRAGGTALMKREPLGLGDVKFYAAAGFWLGLNADAAIAFMLISGILGVVFTLAWKKRTGHPEAPFAPPLIIAFATAVCLFPSGLVLN